MLGIGVRSWGKPVCAATQPVRSTNVSLAKAFGANQQDIGTAKTLTTYLALLYMPTIKVSKK